MNQPICSKCQKQPAIGQDGLCDGCERKKVTREVKKQWRKIAKEQRKRWIEGK